MGFTQNILHTKTEHITGPYPYLFNLTIYTGQLLSNWKMQMSALFARMAKSRIPETTGQLASRLECLGRWKKQQSHKK